MLYPRRSRLACDAARASALAQARETYFAAVVLVATTLAARPAWSHESRDPFSEDAVSSASSPAQPVAPPAAAPPADRDTIWWSLGHGVGAVGGGVGIGGRLGLTFGHGAQIVRLRLSAIGDFSDCDPFCSVEPHNSDADFAILYGGKIRGGGYLAVATLGAAAMWTVRRGDIRIGSEPGFFGAAIYNETDRFSIGVTGEAGVYFSSRYFAFGPTLWFHASWVGASAAVLLDFNFGTLGPVPRQHH